MGLIARAIEQEGIPTTLTSWNAGIIRMVRPPRFSITSMQRGMTLGHPNDVEQQQRILTRTLELLSFDAPLDPLVLNEK